MTDEIQPFPEPLPVPSRRPRFPLGRACAISCIPGLIAAGVVIWMAMHHHAHFRLAMIRGLGDWVYWPIATIVWFFFVSGVPLLVSIGLWAASHLTPQP